jgi:hypothetical protein
MDIDRECFYVSGTLSNLFVSVAAVFAVMVSIACLLLRIFPTHPMLYKSRTFFYKRAFIKVETIIHYFFNCRFHSSFLNWHSITNQSHLHKMLKCFSRCNDFFTSLLLPYC